MTELLEHALLWGTLLSCYLSVAFIGLAIIDPEMWLNDYPPDIREKFGPMSRGAKMKARILGIPVMLGALAWVVVGTVRFADGNGDAVSFGLLYLHTLVVMMVFNVVDLLLIDWLFLVRLRPGFMILPGTEGSAGYGDYGFHWRAFLKGSGGIAVLSALIAGVIALVV